MTEHQRTIAIDAYRTQIERLCREYHVRTLSVFGSAGRDDFDPTRSDIDVLVDFEPLPPGTHADTYFGLLESLTELLGRPVDLVVARAIRNPYFRQSVEASRRLIYAA